LGRVLPDGGASAAPAGGTIHSAPGRLGHHACRHYDRRARCIAATETARAARRSFRAVFGKPGPMLSPGDESPFGENRGGTPAGERARKRRAAQAALLRGASRTPLACGHHDNASAGVPLPFIFCRGRVDKKRLVDETASTARAELLRGLVVCRQQNSGAKNRAARTNDLILRRSALFAPSLEG
jgi:hypothetical protein